MLPDGSLEYYPASKIFDKYEPEETFPTEPEPKPEPEEEEITEDDVRQFIRDNATFHYNEEGELHTIAVHDELFKLQEYLQEEHDIVVPKEELKDVSFIGKDIEGSPDLYGELEPGDENGYTRFAYDEEGNEHKKWTPNLSFVSNDEVTKMSESSVPVPKP